MIAPYFDGESVVAYGWCFVHCSDIGGRVPSSISPLNDSIYSEGLQIPPVRLVRAGHLSRDVEAMILRNTRTPDANRGDFQAMLAALDAGRRRISELTREHSAPAVAATGGYLIAETAGRSLAALGRLTDGEYRFVDYLDNDAVSRFPVRISITLTVNEGRVAIDFTGTDPEVPAAFNIASCGTVHAWLTTRVMVLIGTLVPDINLNGGLLEHVTLIAEPGSLVNAERPAAVGVRHATASRINDVLSGVLAQAAPETLPAASSGVIIPVVLAEHDGRRNVQVVEPMVGGMGARMGSDGVDGRDSGISNLSNNPVETVEAELGVTILRYSLRQDSGGAGRWRGGVGQELVFEVDHSAALLTRGIERRTFRPWGLYGGRPGATTELVINEGTDHESRPILLDVLELAPGDTVTLRTAGAGGYGDPLTRDLSAVQADVRSGLVSVQSALDDYGVVIDDAGVIDDETTQAVRRGSSRILSRFGTERDQWEIAFPQDVYDLFLQRLGSYPASRRSATRAKILQEAMRELPRSFPQSIVPKDELIAVSRRFTELVEELPPPPAADTVAGI